MIPEKRRSRGKSTKFADTHSSSSEERGERGERGSLLKATASKRRRTSSPKKGCGKYGKEQVTGKSRSRPGGHNWQ